MWNQRAPLSHQAHLKDTGDRSKQLPIAAAAAVQLVSDNELRQPDILNLGHNTTAHWWLNFSDENMNIFEPAELYWLEFNFHSTANTFSLFSKLL